MLDWWNSLQQQERQIISLGSIILVVCLCYIGIWEPLQIKQQQLTKHLNHQEQLYRWVINASHQAKQIQQSQPKSQRNNQSILSIVDQQIKSAQFSSHLQQLKPIDNKKVKIWFELISFDQFIRWLGVLSQKYGVHTQSIHIEYSSKPGLVNIRTTLAKTTS